MIVISDVCMFVYMCPAYFPPVQQAQLSTIYPVSGRAHGPPSPELHEVPACATVPVVQSFSAGVHRGWSHVDNYLFQLKRKEGQVV